MHVEPQASLRPEVIAEFADAWPSGVAVSRSGRIFVSFPRLEPAPAEHTLVELVPDGSRVPFPDPAVNAYDESDPTGHFRSVHGITMGPHNRLLALDTGARGLERCDVKAAKIWSIDLDTNAIAHAIGFAEEVCLPTSYFNDLVIDPNRGKAGTAYITDSGANGPNGIVVVDLDSGHAFRRLSGRAVVRGNPSAGFGIATDVGVKPFPPVCDGIAIAPDGKTLWWTLLGTTDFFSVETDLLFAHGVADEVLERHVVSHGPRAFASDGLDCDREGRVYLTDVTHGTLQRYLPAERRFETLLGGTGYMSWPDGVRLGPDRLIYITDSQLARAPQWNDGADLRARPWKLYRAAIDGDPGQY